MICIVKIEAGDSENSPEPKAWILASNVQDARKQAYNAGERELAAKLYEIPDIVPAGSYEISEGLWVLAN